MKALDEKQGGLEGVVPRTAKGDKQLAKRIYCGKSPREAHTARKGWSSGVERRLTEPGCTVKAGVMGTVF